MPETANRRLAASGVRFLDRLGNVGVVLSSVAAWALTAVILYDVMLRAFFTPTLWGSEVSVYLMIALAFLGVGATYGVDGHFRVSFVRDLLPERLRLMMDVFGLIVSLLFSLGFIYGSVKLVAFSWSMGLLMPTILRLPIWLLESFLPLGGVLLTLAILRDALRLYLYGVSIRDAKGAAEVV